MSSCTCRKINLKENKTKQNTCSLFSDKKAKQSSQTFTPIELLNCFDGTQQHICDKKGEQEKKKGEKDKHKDLRVDYFSLLCVEWHSFSSFFSAIMSFTAKF
eukprot:gene5169-3717_t